MNGPTESLIALEVALELRILPKFSDDGAPEGMVERPLPVDVRPELLAHADEESEFELVVDK